MFNKKFEDLVTRFLQLNYPVSRVKVDRRFKRAIVLDDGVYFLSDANSSKLLKTKLIAILTKVFDLDPVICTKLINSSLNI